MAQHAKPSVTVTGDSNLHKLRCIRARTRKRLRIQVSDLENYRRAQKEEDERHDARVKQGHHGVPHERIVIKRYYKLEYQAQSWKYAQRVIAKIEVSAEGTNIRFVVTKNRNNSPETIYKRYCKRGKMELWIKDLKYFKADRMSCNSYRANYFRLFLYAAAYVMAHRMKHTVFKGTEVERFTMDSLIKRIMLSAVHIVEKKTFVKISFSPHHRHLTEMKTALARISA